MSESNETARARAEAHRIVWDKHEGNGVALCPRLGPTDYEHTRVCDAVTAALASLHAERDGLRAEVKTIAGLSRASDVKLLTIAGHYNAWANGDADPAIALAQIAHVLGLPWE